MKTPTHLFSRTYLGLPVWLHPFPDKKSYCGRSCPSISHYPLMVFFTDSSYVDVPVRTGHDHGIIVRSFLMHATCNTYILLTLTTLTARSKHGLRFYATVTTHLSFKQTFLRNCGRIHGNTLSLFLSVWVIIVTAATERWVEFFETRIIFTEESAKVGWPVAAATAKGRGLIQFSILTKSILVALSSSEAVTENLAPPDKIAASVFGQQRRWLRRHSSY